jgi:hypothetical protein
MVDPTGLEGGGPGTLNCFIAGPRFGAHPASVGGCTTGGGAYPYGGGGAGPLSGTGSGDTLCDDGSCGPATIPTGPPPGGGTVGADCSSGCTVIPPLWLAGNSSTGADTSDPGAAPLDPLNLPSNAFAPLPSLLGGAASGASNTCAGLFTACVTDTLPDPVLLAGGALPPGMNGPWQAARNTAQWFMKKVPTNPSTIPGAPNQPPQWPRDFQSELTKLMQAALDAIADTLSDTVFTVNPCTMSSNPFACEQPNGPPRP